MFTVKQRYHIKVSYSAATKQQLLMNKTWQHSSQKEQDSVSQKETQVMCVT